MPRCCIWTALRRRPLPRKLSGVFQSARVEDDPLFFGLPMFGPVPHSRRNTVVEDDLTAKGYRILSRLGNGQADIFTREPAGHSRFVFFQGHPEYDAGTLGREYLRDMGRFLRGEQGRHPPSRNTISIAPPRTGWRRFAPWANRAWPRYAGIMGGSPAARPVAGQYGPAVRQLADTYCCSQVTKAGQPGGSHPSPGLVTTNSAGKARKTGYVAARNL